MKLRCALLLGLLLSATSAHAQQAGPYFRLKLQSSHFVPPSGYVNVWGKTANGHVYRTDSSGNDTDLTDSGGGSTSGDLIPSGDLTRVIGAATTGRYLRLFTVEIDSGGTNDLLFQTNDFDRLKLGRTTTNVLTSGVSNGSSAIGGASDTFNSFSTAGSRLWEFRNATTAKSGIDKDGGFLGPSAGLDNTHLNVFPSANGSTYVVLALQQDFSKDVGSADFPLTDASTITVDCSNGNTFTLLLTGSGHTMGNPTNCKGGHTYQFLVKQAAGGSDTLLWDTKYLYSGGAAPTQTATASKTDIYSCTYLDSPDKMYCVWVGNF